MLINIVGLTACTNTNKSDTSDDVDKKTTIEMKLDKNYDDSDPFINERLFCVSDDMDILNAEVSFQMDGESAIVEIKDNKTDEVLWSNTWNKSVDNDKATISL